MDCIVCKFGGSSVATQQRIEQVASIIEENKRRRCVVLSAPGKAPGLEIKVTDMLLTISKKALEDEDISAEISMVKQRYRDIYSPLGVENKDIDEVLDILDQRVQADKSDALRYRDALVASGEDFNARLFARYLQHRGKDAVYLSPQDTHLLVTSTFGDAQPLKETTENLVKLKELCAEKIVVFPGFFGVTQEGHIATFSRGGSDLTGALLAEAIDAGEYENFTDVDGIFSANPTIVDSPRQIPALTYKEMRELSYIGFNVLHEEAVKPVMFKKIPIRLRNTNNLKNDGTLIVAERLPSERDVVGIASGGRYCSFTLQKFLMNREKGFGRRLLSIFEELNLSFEHCPSGVDNISVILDQTQMKPGSANAVIRTIEKELNPDYIKTEFDIALVAVVGEGLIQKVGLLSQAAHALSSAGVNIKMVNQGSSEISVIFGIDADDESEAVNALYKEFFS